MSTLLQRIAAGDASAVRACVDEYGGLVWRLSLRYLGSPADAEDAAQEIFVSVWSSAARFDPSRGSEPAFVATIAHRRLTDIRRARAVRTRTRLAEWAPPESLDSPSGDEQAEIVRAFDRLPEDERHALWLSLCQGMSHRQVADATAAPVGTVKTRIRRGMARLREVVVGSEAGSGNLGVSP